MPGNSVGNGTLDTEKKNIKILKSQICQNQLNSRDGSLGPTLFLMYTDHKLKIGMMPWYAGAYAMLVVSYLNAHSVWKSAKRSHLWILNCFRIFKTLNSRAKSKHILVWVWIFAPNFSKYLTFRGNPCIKIRDFFYWGWISLTNVVKMRHFRIDFQLPW